MTNGSLDDLMAGIPTAVASSSAFSLNLTNYDIVNFLQRMVSNSRSKTTVVFPSDE